MKNKTKELKTVTDLAEQLGLIVCGDMLSPAIIIAPSVKEAEQLIRNTIKVEFDNVTEPTGEAFFKAR